MTGKGKLALYVVGGIVAALSIGALCAETQKRKKISEWIVMNIDCINKSQERLRVITDASNFVVGDLLAAIKEEEKFLEIVRNTDPY